MTISTLHPENKKEKVSQFGCIFYVHMFVLESHNHCPISLISRFCGTLIHNQVNLSKKSVN